MHSALWQRLRLWLCLWFAQFCVRAPQFIAAGAQVSRDGDHKSPRSNMAYTQRTQTQRKTTTARYAGQLCQHMTPCWFQFERLCVAACLCVCVCACVWVCGLLNRLAQEIAEKTSWKVTEKWVKSWISFWVCARVFNTGSKHPLDTPLSPH